jgi:hypothetical protein
MFAMITPFADFPERLASNTQRGQIDGHRSDDRGRFARRVVIGIVLIAFPLAAARGVQGESWTDLRGTRTIEADLVGLFGDQVVLRMSDGRRVTVKLDQLRAESRIQAKELSDRRASRRSDRIAELRRQANVAAAAAPDPLPEPPPAPDYEPPSDGMSAVETLEYLDRQMFQGGHLLAFYDSLPDEYRDQLDQLVAQASLKIDDATWDAVTGSVYELGDFIVTHQNWIFSHPRLKALGDDAAEQLQEQILSWAGFLRSGFDPDVMPLNDLQTMPLREWLVRWDQATSPYLAELARQEESEPVSFEQTGERGDVVSVRIEQGEDQSLSLSMIQVDGRWTFQALADQWPKIVESAQESLDEMPDGSIELDGVAAMLPTMVRTQTQSLRDASDAAEFHAMLDQVLNNVIPSPEVLAAMMPESFGTPRNTQGGYPGGTSGEMEEEMYEGSGYDEGYDPDAALR